VYFVKIDKQVISTFNKAKIIDIIRKKGPINKAEIARLSELSLPTIMKIVDGLIGQGVVRCMGKAHSTGGKRPELVQFASDFQHIVGVDIGRSSIKVIVMDLSAKIIASNINKTTITDPSLLVDSISTTIIELIKTSGIDEDKLLGIGVGVAGIIDAKNGRVIFSPDFDWVDIDFAEMFNRKLDFPIRYENVTRAVAMSEYWYGAGSHKDLGDYICLALSYGIGAAIVINGELYRGNSEASGEFGHINLKKDGPLCDCGNYGCLEALSSGNAIRKSAQSLIKQGHGRHILKLAENELENVECKTVFDAAKENDEDAMKIVDDAIEYLGMGIANLINLFDPKTIFLSGGMVNAGEMLFEKLNREVKKRQMGFSGRSVVITKATFDEYAAAIGAASLLLKELIESGGDRLSLQC